MAWPCWCLSEYVNAAGYFLLWKRGRRKSKDMFRTPLVESDVQAAKDRSVLMRRVEKYQQRGWAHKEPKPTKRSKYADMTTVTKVTDEELDAE